MGLFGKKGLERLQDLKSRIAETDWSPDEDREAYAEAVADIKKKYGSTKPKDREKALEQIRELGGAFLDMAEGFWRRQSWDDLDTWIREKADELTTGLGVQNALAKAAERFLELLDEMVKTGATQESVRAATRTLQTVHQSLDEIERLARDALPEMQRKVSGLFYAYANWSRTVPEPVRVELFVWFAYVCQRLGASDELMPAWHTALSAAYAAHDSSLIPQTVRDWDLQLNEAPEHDLDLCQNLVAVLLWWGRQDKETVTRFATDLIVAMSMARDLAFGQSPPLRIPATEQVSMLTRILDWAMETPLQKQTTYCACMRSLAGTAAMEVVAQHVGEWLDEQVLEEDPNVFVPAGLIQGELYLRTEAQAEEGKSKILEACPAALWNRAALGAAELDLMIGELAGVDSSCFSPAEQRLLANDLRCLKGEQDDTASLEECYRIKEVDDSLTGLDDRIRQLSGDKTDPSAALLKILYHFRRREYPQIRDVLASEGSATAFCRTLRHATTNLLASRVMAPVLTSDPVRADELPYSASRLRAVAAVPSGKFSLPRSVCAKYWSERGAEGAAPVSSEQRKDCWGLVKALIEADIADKNGRQLVVLAWITQVGFTGSEWNEASPLLQKGIAAPEPDEAAAATVVVLVLADIGARLGDYCRAMNWLQSSGASVEEHDDRLASLFSTDIPLDDPHKTPKLHTPPVESDEDARLALIREFVRQENPSATGMIVRCGDIYLSLWRFGIHGFLHAARHAVRAEDTAQWCLQRLTEIKNAVESQPSLETTIDWRPWYFFFAASAGNHAPALDVLTEFYSKTVTRKTPYQAPEIPGWEGLTHIATLAFGEARMRLHGPRQENLVSLLATDADRDTPALRTKRKALLYAIQESRGDEPSLEALLLVSRFADCLEDVESGIDAVVWRTGGRHEDTLEPVLRKLASTEDDPALSDAALRTWAIINLLVGKGLSAWIAAVEQTQRGVTSLARGVLDGCRRLQKAKLLDPGEPVVRFVMSICATAQGGPTAVESFEEVLEFEATREADARPCLLPLARMKDESPWILLLYTCAESDATLKSIWSDAHDLIDHREIAAAALALLERRLPLDAVRGEPPLLVLHAVCLAWRQDVESTRTAVGIFEPLVDGLEVRKSYTTALMQAGNYLAAQGELQLSSLAKRLAAGLLERSADRRIVAAFYLDALMQDPASCPAVEDSLAAWSEEDLSSPEALLLLMQIAIIRENAEEFLKLCSAFVLGVQRCQEEGIKPPSFREHFYRHLERLGEETPALGSRALLVKGKVHLVESDYAPAISSLRASQIADPQPVDDYLDELDHLSERITDIDLRRGVIGLHLGSAIPEQRQRGVGILADFVDVTASFNVPVVIETARTLQPAMLECHVDVRPVFNALTTVIRTERNRTNTDLAQVVAEVSTCFEGIDEQINHTLHVVTDVSEACQDVLIAAAKRLLADQLAQRPNEAIAVGQKLVEIGRYGNAWYFLLEPSKVRAHEIRGSDSEDYRTEEMGRLEKIYAQLIGLDFPREAMPREWQEVLAWLGFGLGNPTYVVKSALTIFNGIAHYPANEMEVPAVLVDCLQDAQLKDAWEVNFAFGEIHSRIENHGAAVTFLEAARRRRNAEPAVDRPFEPLLDDPFHPESHFTWEKWTDWIGTGYRNLRRWAEAVAMYRAAISREKATLEDVRTRISEMTAYHDQLVADEETGSEGLIAAGLARIGFWREKATELVSRQKPLRRLLWDSQHSRVADLLEALKAKDEMSAEFGHDAQGVAEQNQEYGYPHGIDLSVGMLRKALSTVAADARVPVLLGLAQCYLDQGVFPASREALDMIHEPPGDPALRIRYFWTLGIVNQELGRYAEAAVALSRCLVELDPAKDPALSHAVGNRLKNLQLQTDLLWESPKYILPQLDLAKALE